MIKPIMKDPLFLSRKSTEAGKEDTAYMQDLVDTLKANSEHCVGMAANMIGVSKRIIAFYAGPFVIGMYNPVILQKTGLYETEEGCLSLTGVRPANRYENITVEYLDHNFNPMTRQFSGFIAQIIQHELDHFSGIII